MYTEIATETLKTGETLNVVCVMPPEATYQAQIVPFLGHKPDNYRAHIDAAFAGQCDDLETRFYLGLLDGQGRMRAIIRMERVEIVPFGSVDESFASASRRALLLGRQSQLGCGQIKVSNQAKLDAVRKMVSS